MANRGRPRGSKNKAKTQHQQAADPGGSPHASQLSDDQEHKLLAHHVERYQRDLEAKKKADAVFKNTCKTAKAEGISLADIKLAIELQTPEGEEKLRAETNRRLQIARWSGMAIGEQADLFPNVDRTPLSERARAAGKRSGIEGKGSGENPHDANTEAGREWEAGRVEGMGVKIQEGIKPLAADEPGTQTLIAANRPDAAPVTSNDDPPEPEIADGAGEQGATDDAAVDADVVDETAPAVASKQTASAYGEDWKSKNVAKAETDDEWPDIPESLDRRGKPVMAEPDF